MTITSTPGQLKSSKYDLESVEAKTQQGRRQGGGAKGAIAPPFFRGKEQNLQLTGVELAPWSFQLDFVLLSWTLAGS